MNNLNQNVHAYGSNNRPKISSARKDYPSEVEEVFRQDNRRLVYKMAGGLAGERGVPSAPTQVKL